jgi:hypothetical protein
VDASVVELSVWDPSTILLFKLNRLECVLITAELWLLVVMHPLLIIG